MINQALAKQHIFQYVVKGYITLLHNRDEKINLRNLWFIILLNISYKIYVKIF